MENTDPTEPKKITGISITGETIEFDSYEEWEMYQWCIEAKDHDLLRGFTYHPHTYKLSERVSVKVAKTNKRTGAMIGVKDKFLFHPHSYTPDFYLWVAPALVRLCPAHGLHLVSGFAVVDVKGAFSRFHDQKSFSINQKWVYQLYGHVVCKVVPEKFFFNTWVPEECRYTQKKRDVRKKYSSIRTLSELLADAAVDD